VLCLDRKSVLAGSPQKYNQRSQRHSKAHTRSDELENVHVAKALESGLMHKVHESAEPDDRRHENGRNQSFSAEHIRLPADWLAKYTTNISL
jgi:hypothetical protein